MAVIIDKGGDFVIKVFAKEDMEDSSGHRVSNIVDEREFVVSRSVLINHSPVIAADLRSGKSKDPDNEYVIHARSIPSVEMWLNIIHGVNPDFDVSIEDVWLSVQVCNQYDFAIDVLNAWFESWYEHHFKYRNFKDLQLSEEALKEARQLLFPCWRFDYAKGFLDVTRYLVYGCDFHVIELNPTNEKTLHVPARFIRESTKSLCTVYTANASR